MSTSTTDTNGKNQLKGFSFSGISTFQNCPRAFKYRYIEKLPEAFNTIEAHMGTCVHEALEWAYTQRKDGREPDLEGALEQYRGAWNKDNLGDLKVVKDEKTREDYFNDGKQFLAYFMEDVFPNDKSETLYLEHHFQVPLEIGGDKIIYRGIIDRIARQPDGTLRVIDYKTGKVGHPLDTLQLPSYGLYVMMHNMDPKVELCYEDLREKQTRVVSVTRKNAKETKDKIKKEIETILNADDVRFVAKPSILCLWCGYNEICPAAYKKDNGTPAVTNSEAVEVPTVCPECGSNLRQRTGKFGAFLGCTNYPECKFTHDLSGKPRQFTPKPPTDTEAKTAAADNDTDSDEKQTCPECGGQLNQRNGKYGAFLGCANFPNCRYTQQV